MPEVSTMAGKLRAKYDRWLDGSSPSASSSEDDKRRSTTEKSLYEILSIDNKATTEEIKDAAQAAVSATKWLVARM
jgi:hypothetical protein